MEYKEYLDVPLSTEPIIMDLTNEQAGRLFEAALIYAFENKKPDFSDDVVLKKAFSDFIKQCKKHGEMGCMGYTEFFDDFVED
jgi:hypothetical protein